MAVTIAKLRANGVLDNSCKEWGHDPVCPKILEAVGRVTHCDDPFCSTYKKCAFKDHPRGRAKWLAMDLDLTNWSA